MTALSVNLNKVALLRNAREGDAPSLIEAAVTVVEAGADGITVHPRPDQRHIRPSDVTALAQFLKAHPGIEFNIEGNPFAGPRVNGYPGFDRLIEQAKPQQATLVPDSDHQLTSDHGFDLSGDNAELAGKIERYKRQGARVSLFMDPVPTQISLAQQIGADRVELYTGPFANTVSQFGMDDAHSRAALAKYQEAARHAAQLGLGVNAGHDLDLDNLPLFRNIRELAEVSIGHALIARALHCGLTAAVQAFKQALDGATQPAAGG